MIQTALRIGYNLTDDARFHEIIHCCRGLKSPTQPAGMTPMNCPARFTRHLLAPIGLIAVGLGRDKRVAFVPESLVQ